MKKSLFYLSSLFFSLFLWGFEPLPTQTLLLSYLQNDSQLQDLTLAAQKAELSYAQTKINNGFDITLSTGTITIKSENGGTSVTAKPYVTFSMPTPALTATAKTSLSTPAPAAGPAPAQDTSLSLSAELLGSASSTAKISLKKSERAVKEAQRKLQKRAIAAEKEFYTNLKSLLTEINSIIQKENSLYSDQIDFEQIKAQGYSEKSSTYKLAQMRVLSDQHDIESSKRTLLNNYIVFYIKCGSQVELSVNQDFMELVPSDITELSALDIHSFDSEQYTEIENAVWAHQIAEEERNIRRNFSLSANAGYTFGNSTTNSDTIDAGISGMAGGVAVGGGISIPLLSNSTPAYTFSATITPNTFRTNSISLQNDQLTREQEILAIQTARTNYETAVVASLQSLEQIKWEKSTNDESYQMYKELSEELAVWYSQGIITESSYLSAKTNMQMYGVKKIINLLNIIIYNDDVIGMFDCKMPAGDDL